MRVLACVKRVPAPGSRIALTEDALEIDATHLAFTTSPHEECAVEEAVRIVEAHGGETTVLSAGPREAEEQLRHALSVGVDRAVLVETDGTDWDPERTAAALAEAVRGIEERDGPFDLILFGNESADAGGFQVGIRVARALGRPMVNGIKAIDVDGGTVNLRRAVEAGYEVYRLPLPAVAGVREGINLPRYPTLKGRLASKKAVIGTVSATAPPGQQQMLRLVRPVEQEGETNILGAGAEAAVGIVDLFQELGVL